VTLFAVKPVKLSTIRYKLSLNILLFGTIRVQHDVPLSETPENCCWTWPAMKTVQQALATSAIAPEKD
jgi:hypothetical protein